MKRDQIARQVSHLELVYQKYRDLADVQHMIHHADNDQSVNQELCRSETELDENRSPSFAAEVDCCVLVVVFAVEGDHRMLAGVAAE